MVCVGIRGEAAERLTPSIPAEVIGKNAVGGCVWEPRVCLVSVTPCNRVCLMSDSCWVTLASHCDLIYRRLLSASLHPQSLLLQSVAFHTPLYPFFVPFFTLCRCYTAEVVVLRRLHSRCGWSTLYCGLLVVIWSAGGHKSEQPRSSSCYRKVPQRT